MLKSIKEKQMSAKMVKHFLVTVLLFPLYTSSVDMPYSPDIVYSNVFVTLFVVLAILEGNIDWKRRSWLGYVVAAFLVGFNAFALAVNLGEYPWFYGQANMTIAFLFFLAWLFMKKDAACMGESMICFLMGTGTVILLVGLIPGLLGVEKLNASVRGYDIVPVSPYDRVYSWVYFHKSEYSFILVLFLALIVTYRHLFRKKWQFWGSVGVFAVGLMLANTRVTMLAALFIPAGVMLDYLMKRAGGFRWKYLLWLLPFVLVGVVMLAYFSRERDILTLGYRTYIWESAVDRIFEFPDGAGVMAGLQPFYVERWGRSTNNCHNVFLNFMLQFSVRAGLCCIAMMVSIFIAAMIKNRSFQTLGIIIALLIPLNMDWCLLLGQVPLALIVFYFLFFYPNKKPA